MASETTEETAARSKAPAKPADPRRAPDVVHALKIAARRDPHPDPFKGIGRASLLVWIAIAATLAVVAAGVTAFLDLPELTAQIQDTFEGLAGSPRERARAFDEVQRDQQKMAVVAVAGFAGGTLIFALYYAAVYLVGMNVRRLAAELGIVFQAGAQKIRAVARRVRAANRKRAASDEVIVEKPPAGPQPHGG